MPKRGGKEKRGEKKKKRSNKEVDISWVHPRALNTFLLHFNGFLKPIFMQIKARLSKRSQKPGLGPVGKPGSPSHPLSVWSDCGLAALPTRTPWLSPSLQEVRTADVLDA